MSRHTFARCSCARCSNAPRSLAHRCALTIEKLMRSMNQPQLARVIPNEAPDDEPEEGSDEPGAKN